MTLSRRDFLATAALGLTAPLPTFVQAQSVNARSAASLFVERFCSKGAALDNDNGNVWHSESVGVSLLACARSNNSEKFSKIYEQAQLLRRKDGLYSWKAKGTRVLDFNNASDGDVYIAWALLEAQKRGLDLPFDAGAKARELMRSIEELCVRPSSHGLIIVPGVYGFISTKSPWIINPSYWVFPAFHEFQLADSAGPWADLSENGLRILKYSRFGRFDLPPDWLELSSPVRPAEKLSTRFSYDAMRVALYLAQAGHYEHPALKNTVRFFKSSNRSWIDLNTSALSPYGMDDSAQVVLTVAQGGKSMDRLSRKYYPASLAVLGNLQIQS